MTADKLREKANIVGDEKYADALDLLADASGFVLGCPCSCSWSSDKGIIHLCSRCALIQRIDSYAEGRKT